MTTLSALFASIIRLSHYITNSPGKLMARSVWRHASDATRSFFMPNVHQSDDPLAQLVRQQPAAAARFIRWVLGFGGVVSLSVVAACAVFLSQNWEQSGLCARPLRLWLTVYTALNALSVPVRVLFLAKVLHADFITSNADRLAAVVESITASPAWALSKKVSLLIYVWFVFGAIWLLNSGGCPACPGIHKMVIVVILQSALRAVASLVTLRVLFPEVSEERPDAPAIQAATSDEIAALPTVRFSKGCLDEDDTSCAVCLSEYKKGDSLRKLPCGHHFHCACADKWLRQSKRCPLCVQPIDNAENKLRRR